MRYDLLLQPTEPGKPYDAAPVETLLTARGAMLRADGSRLWRLKSGDIEVRPLLENGVAIATELRVPLSDKTELIRELLQEGLTLATEAGVRLVDPALSKTVTLADEGLITDQYFRTAQYAGQYGGVSEAVIAGYGAAEPEGLKAGTKVLVGIAVFLFFLWFVFDRLF